MSWLQDVIGGSAGEVLDSVGGIADRFIETDDERREFKGEMARLMAERDAQVEQTIRAELEAKQSIMVAELNQGDLYTKRARPSVIYVGLIFIALNHVIWPMATAIAGAFGLHISQMGFDLPDGFWYAWGGLCCTYVVGRSMEKRGSYSRMVNAITGSGPTGGLL